LRELIKKKAVSVRERYFVYPNGKRLHLPHEYTLEDLDTPGYPEDYRKQPEPIPQLTEMPDIPADAWRMVELAQKDAEDLSGAQFNPEPPAPGSRTATGVERAADKANGKNL
jgi:hypothetical protein